MAGRPPEIASDRIRRGREVSTPKLPKPPWVPPTPTETYGPLLDFFDGQISSMNDLVEERDKLRAENERMRAALLVIKHDSEPGTWVRRAAEAGLSEGAVNEGKAFDEGDG